MAKFKTTTDVVPAVYREGDKFAQLLILPIADATFTETLELSDSDRGDGGYGSTDVPTENTQSAPTGSVDSPAIEETNDQQTANIGSGGEANIPEQA